MLNLRTIVVGLDGAVVEEPGGQSDTVSPQRRLADKWVEVRLERDRRLAASDWVVLRSIEVGATVPAAWQQYRQALRDVTAQPDPFAITWPTPPA